MASPIDILLKIGADVRGAVTGVRSVEEGAKKATAEVDRLDSRLEQVARKAKTRAATGTGAIGGALASGSSLGEALGAGLGAAFPEFGIPVAAGQAAGNLIDQLQGETAREARAAAALQSPTSVQGAADALRDLAKARAGKFSFRRFLRQGGDILTKGDSIVSPGDEDRRREVRKAFRDLARSNLALAIAVAGELGNPSDLVKIIADTRTEQANAAKSQQFLSGLPGSTTTITNVYTAFDGLGGAGSVGRDVRATLDRRDRNNGRYVSTSSRR